MTSAALGGGGHAVSGVVFESEITWVPPSAFLRHTATGGKVPALRFASVVVVCLREIM
ncbi:MAG: hypothetical protein AAF989_10430 [Planctomycetota bacterium]